MSRLSILGKTFIFLLLVGATFIAISTFKTPKAAAALYCSAPGQPWVHTDVWVEVQDSNGNFLGYSQSFSMLVTGLMPNGDAFAPPYVPPGTGSWALDQIVAPNIPGPDTNSGGWWYHTTTATTPAGSLHNCGQAGLPGGGGPAYDMIDGSNGNYYLNCLNDSNVGIAVTALTQNDPAFNAFGTGGSFVWGAGGNVPGNNSNAQYIFANGSILNYHQFGIVFVYKLNPPNPSFTCGNQNGTTLFETEGQNYTIVMGVVETSPTGDNFPPNNVGYAIKYPWGGVSGRTALPASPGSVPPGGATNIFLSFTPTSSGTYTIYWDTQNWWGPPFPCGLNVVVVPPPPNFVCQPLIITSTPPYRTGTSISVTMEATNTQQYSNAVFGSNASFNYSYSGPGVSVGPVGVTPAGSYGQWATVSVPLTIATSATAGTYTVHWNVSPGASCTGTFLTHVINQPTLRAYGGDVVAGSTFTAPGGQPGSCTPTSASLTAGVISWSNASAGTDMGVQAMDEVYGFNSDYSQPSSSSGKLNSLDFANTTTFPAYALYGGDFAAAPCTLAYTPIASAPTWSAADYGTSGNYNWGGGTLNLSGTIPAGVHITIYVASGSSVYINNPGISYSTAGWTSQSQIPSFKVVTLGGNIYIDQNVTHLDGSYVAEPTGSTSQGIIYTCGSGGGFHVVNNTNYVTDCSKQLTVDGAFVARQIQFMRTYGGTLNGGAVNQNAPGAGAPTTNAAEVFVYGPDTWLANPSSTTTPTANFYNAITGLPPIL